MRSIISLVMKFHLNHKQVISVTPVLRFRHYSKDGTCYIISLNENQFRNLDDLLAGYNSLASLEYYPLGEGLWLQRKKSHISIIDNYSNNTFTFTPTSLINYKTFVHSHIKNIFRYGATHHYQSYANYESSKRFQSTRRGARRHSHYKQETRKKRKDRRNHTHRGCVSYISEEDKIVHRSTRNASDENEKPTKHTNISRRHSTDFRTTHRRRSGRDEARIRQEIEEGEVDAKLESDPDDDKEFSNESADAEGNSSPQYQLE